MSLERVAQILKDSRKVALLSHATPDGDAVGTSLALWEALKNMGQEAGIFSADNLPYTYSFLPYAERWQKVKALPGGYDTVVILECAHLRRTGLLSADNNLSLSPGGKENVKLINIDHHLNNEKYAHANWVEEQAPAVGEMVYRLLVELGVKITPTMATNLMAAIVTDTGSFHYSSTTPAALRAAAHLMELGASVVALDESLNYQKRPSELRLLGRVLETLEVEEQYGLAWMEVTPQMLQATGGALEETDEFAGFPRSISTVKVVIFFKEIESGITKVSLRSKGAVDAAQIAMKFGGGGHENAAGCRLEKPLAQAKKLVLEAAREYLKSINKVKSIK